MSVPPVRFLHTSDLHLELPLFGVAEVPDHLVDLFLDAPLRAAEKVFDIAVQEGVDFVILAGDIVNPALAGPRAVVFLREQFERLAQRQIGVYWAGGRVESTDLWFALRPPANLYTFSRGSVEEVVHRREGAAVVEIVGLSRGRSGQIRASDFRRQTRSADSLSAIRVAVAHGSVDPRLLSKQHIDYWAFGGPHESAPLNLEKGRGRYSGSPQGRQPAESGPHGCWLVEIDADRTIREELIETDAVRWHTMAVTAADSMSVENLLNELEEQLLRLADECEIPALVTIQIAGRGPAVDALGKPDAVQKTLRSLREEWGTGTIPVWTVDLEVTPSTKFPASWYDEDTILGEYLRQVRELASDPSCANPLEELNSAEQNESLAALVNLADEQSRQEILRRTALLGSQLLSSGPVQEEGVTVR